MGNVSHADSTGIAEQITKKINDQMILFSFIFEEEYQENMFDMYVWKEKVIDEFDRVYLQSNRK